MLAHKESPNMLSNVEASIDPDYLQPCLKCPLDNACSGFVPHPWRKRCQVCKCSRDCHLSGEIKTRREKKGVNEFVWAPVGCDKLIVGEYMSSLPQYCVPRIGTEGEVWRQEQIHLQIPEYDTDASASNIASEAHVESLNAMVDVRLSESFDVGEVIRCPDLRHPAECGECHLREDGTHWAYCKKFLPPLDEEGSSTVVIDKVKTSHPVSRQTDDPVDCSSIKSMRRRGATLNSDDSRPIPVNEPTVPPSATVTKRLPSGYSCHGCSESFYIDEVVVACGRFFEDEQDTAMFHPSCFMCSQCGEILVDNRAFVDVGKEERGHTYAKKRLFCGRHWAENRVSRCNGCDELIFDREYVFEFGHAFHRSHFCCEICDVNLTTLESFVPRGRSAYCFPCYGEKFADKCKSCTLPINPSPGFGGKISVGGSHWHSRCFKCVGCEVQLTGKPCVPRDDGIYCKKCFKRFLSNSA